MGSIEIGHVNSLAAAARLYASLRHELGCEIVSMEIREIDVPPRVSSVPYHQVRARGGYNRPRGSN